MYAIVILHKRLYYISHVKLIAANWLRFVITRFEDKNICATRIYICIHGCRALDVPLWDMH